MRSSSAFYYRCPCQFVSFSFSNYLLAILRLFHNRRIPTPAIIRLVKMRAIKLVFLEPFVDLVVQMAQPEGSSASGRSLTESNSKQQNDRLHSKSSSSPEVDISAEAFGTRQRIRRRDIVAKADGSMTRALFSHLPSDSIRRIRQLRMLRP